LSGLAVLYLLSGAGAVAVETIWMRWLQLLFGATAPAASATLVAFFTGHALGALWAGARSRSWRRPLVVYGRLELAGVLGAAAVPVLLRLGELAVGPAYDALRSAPAALAAVRLGIAGAATLPAAFCFGATFPAIGTAAVEALVQLGARGSALYAANTLGAAAGTALATFWLPGALGVGGTYAVALALSGAAGGGALLLASRRAGTDAVEARPARRPGGSRGRDRSSAAGAMDAGRSVGPRALLALAVLSGLCPFALQVLLVGSFAQVLDESSWAFGAVLVVVLLSIAAAGGLVAWSARRGRPDPRTLLGAALVVAAVSVAAFPALLDRATGGLGYVGSRGPGLPYVASVLATVAVTAGPALLAGSMVFPLCLVLAGRRGGAPGAGAVIGRLAAANTAGALVGALAAPWVLLPRLGPWAAFVGLAVPWAGAALLVPDARTPRRAGRCAALVVGGALVAAVANPLAVPTTPTAPGERVLAVDPTAAGVVAVVARGGDRLIRVDGHYALGGTAERVHHEREAHLPLLLAPGARRVAYVGSATGISAGGALAHPIDALTLVERVPAVARAGARWFDDANHGVYRDPRTTVVLDDARNFLGNTRATFDVVIADLFVPWHAGVGSLYTREHFRAVRRHLTGHGLFCQWLPLYQLSEPELRVILATFLDVFPRAAVFRGDFFGRFPIVALVGFAGDPPTAAEVSSAAEVLARAGVDDRWVTDPVGPWALYVGPLAPLAPSLSDVPRNSDDRPRIEQLAAAGHAGGTRGKVDPIVGLAWVRFSEALRAAARRDGDPLWPELPAEARRASEGGALLQAAGAFYVTGRNDLAAQAFTRAAEELPGRLVADAPPDDTAAELWRADSPQPRPP
jgi:spermidine synthase